LLNVVVVRFFASFSGLMTRLLIGKSQWFGAVLIALPLLAVCSIADAAPPDPAAAAPVPDRAEVTAKPGKGVTITSANGNYALNIRARIQLRETFTYEDDEPHNEINVKTLRLILSGHVLSKDLGYRIQLAFGSKDFENGNASPIFDAHLDYTRVRSLSIRVGQFFVPFDRARTTREFALHLVDRQQVVRELTLDRDVGVMFYSDDLFGAKQRLGYALFVGGGEGRNRFGGQRMGPLVVGRLVFKPWGNFDDDVEGDLDRRHQPKLAIGFAGAYNVASSRMSSTYGADFQLGTVNQVHAAADLVFKLRGWSLTAEGVLRRALTDELVGTIDMMPAVEATRSGYGYFVQSGIMVHRMVELVARWDDLYAWRGTDPTFIELIDRRGRQVVAGLNVYLNGHALKLQADYSFAFGTGFDPATDPGAHIARVQIDASF
jgi:hypothetical protein